MDSQYGSFDAAHANRMGVASSSIPGEYKGTTERSARAKNDHGFVNAAYEKHAEELSNSSHAPKLITTLNIPTVNTTSQPTALRDNWDNDIEFLMSCIALSVGLGNIWRFPFAALDNGGGAFLIPYLIVLFLVGRPVYYMEMLLGQFSSRGSVKVFDFSPILRGVGYGQVLATGIVTTYYATLMALSLRYLYDSFYPTLPWSYCRPEWGPDCINSTFTTNVSAPSTGESDVKITSAQFYFTEIILREIPSIDDGIGWPNWSLALALALSWLVVGLIMIRGVKSSGKASYFLALFPYVVMFILLIRSLTLPGAFNGVLYFLKPQWSKLLDPQVWYAAVTQVFFSLAICFGNIIMYASYNRFNHRIYRDCAIVTTLDTFTSLLSGIIIFGILGNLAYESNTTDIQSVVRGGTGLAFVSYPDAIAKFQFFPQLFAFIFFLMLFVLGIGSNVGMASCVMTVVKDKFTRTDHWIIVLGIVIVGYCIGLIYITPGGQYILNFLDFYGVTFVALVLAIFELLSVGWIYGTKRFCRDVYFMLGITISPYYRLCWAIVTPALMTAILVYTLVLYEPLQYNGYTYTDGMYVFGWFLSAFGIGQLFIWGLYAIKQQPRQLSLMERFLGAFKPLSDWGPSDPDSLKAYKRFNSEAKVNAMFRKTGFLYKIYDNIFG